MPKAAVLGSPISHSKSPSLHSAAYRALGLPWTYERHEVDAAALQSFLAEHAGEFRGLSLTMPLKERAFELAEWTDPTAVATGAVNTLVYGDELRGYNTDVMGFHRALQASGQPDAESAAILGTGATARSAAIALVRTAVQELHVFGRRPEALSHFRDWLHHHEVEVITHPWDDPMPDVPLVISAAVAGATDGRQLPAVPGLLFEVIYSPWPTEYVSRWMEAGGRVLGGLDLLVHQAAEQVLLMTRLHEDNRDAIVESMYAALRAQRA